MLNKTVSRLYIVVLLLMVNPCWAGSPEPAPGRYFAIEVVDEQTGRGVPMVELLTTSNVGFYTDSAGLVIGLRLVSLQPESLGEHPFR